MKTKVKKQISTRQREREIHALSLRRRMQRLLEETLNGLLTLKKKKLNQNKHKPER